MHSCLHTPPANGSRLPSHPNWFGCADLFLHRNHRVRHGLQETPKLILFTDVFSSPHQFDLCTRDQLVRTSRKQCKSLLRLQEHTVKTWTNFIFGNLTTSSSLISLCLEHFCLPPSGLPSLNLGLQSFFLGVVSVGTEDLAPLAIGERNLADRREKSSLQVKNHAFRLRKSRGQIRIRTDG